MTEHNPWIDRDFGPRRPPLKLTCTGGRAIGQPVRPAKSKRGGCERKRADLSGKGFYGAVVRLDHSRAVIVRVTTK